MNSDTKIFNKNQDYEKINEKKYHRTPEKTFRPVNKSDSLQNNTKL